MNLKLIAKKLIILLFLLTGGFAFAQNFYWDAPLKITEVNSQFPVVVKLKSENLLIFEEVSSSSQIYLNVQKKPFGSNQWSSPVRIAGPFRYSGEVPDIYSAAVSPDGTIAIAALISDVSIGVYVSKDGGSTFVQKKLPQLSQQVVGPRIYSSSKGSFILFAALGANENFTLLSSRSSDGEHWTSLSPFAPVQNLSNPFAPALISTESGDLVVFQAQYQYEHNGQSRWSYQLYSTLSTDGFNSWQPPQLVTDEKSVQNSYTKFQTFSNQRAVLYQQNSKYFMAWERTPQASDIVSIWFSEIDSRGQIISSLQQITSSGSAHRPVFFEYSDTLCLSWFDNRLGNDSIYFAFQDSGWKDSPLVNLKGSAATFAYPVCDESDSFLSFIWQGTPVKKGKPAIYALFPDKTALPPKLKPQNFKAGKKTTSQRARISVELQEDTSGTAGFSWIFTKDENEEPPEYAMVLSDETGTSALSTIEGIAEGDGTFYFKVKSNDYAGNWSESAVLKFVRDITPPKAPVISDCDLDAMGFLNSNAFSLNWNPDSSDDDIAGYSWTLTKISGIDKQLSHSPKHPVSVDEEEGRRQVQQLILQHQKEIENPVKPPRYNQGNKLSASYNNLKNGLYTFSVCAIDEVGNIGEASSAVVLLNKYLPFTLIKSLSSKKDDFGALFISVYGQDFTYDGTIREIYIDRDGKAPYDRVLKLKDKDYKVESDTHISGIHLEELDVGTYYVYLNHSDRGIYPAGGGLTVNRFRVDETGTVKIEKPYRIVPQWQIETKPEKYVFRVADFLMWSLFGLSILGAIAAIRGLALSARESIIIRKEVISLLTGGAMPLENKKKAQKFKKIGISLKFKLVTFTAFLVLMIVLMVSVPLGLNMIKTQERTLAQGLESRVNVLMESITSGVRSYLPSGLDNIIELNYLPKQTDSFDEASYVTILGLSAEKSRTDLDYVWASNDPDILSKIDSDQWSFGMSRLIPSDPGIAVSQKCQSLETVAREQVGDLTSQIRELNSEGVKLALARDQKSIERRRQINEEVRTLNESITSTLNEISVNGSGAQPYFDNMHLDRANMNYLFYKPVLYRQGGEENLVHAVILMEVSTENLIKEVDSARNTILYTAGIIALVAIALGIFGSYFLASIIVKPIKELVSHVNKIGETSDKLKLKGYTIKVKSNDEIGTLGFAVNDMTDGLVKAAEAEELRRQKEKMELDGKAIQQTFLPLKQVSAGGKETVAQLDDSAIQFFGYYEGADAVSGDYFDYKKLDERFYAIIKADVSGHGVPAGMIMTVVATLFRRYFENWSLKTHGTSLDKLVIQINDMIESLGAKGKFATLMICLFDTKSGDVYMCNAGDNVVHIFDSTLKKEKVLTLHEAPAAGPLPSFMVEMKGGYKVEKTHLNSGDVLFLYTDGIEEATRFFRDENYEITKCAEPGLKEGDVHQNHKVGLNSEQMEPERVKNIVESIFNKKSYKLIKYHSPLPDEELIFDFTKCQGQIDEVILGLAAVEKVFRMYKAPSARGTVVKSEAGDVIIQGDGIRVDRKIDAFLKKTFNRYDYYGAGLIDMDEPNYVYYTNINEDPQADDLTLLAVKKL